MSGKAPHARNFGEGLPHCGFVVYNDTLSCVQWCKYARQCVGDAMYEQMMAIAERQKANRKLRKSEDNTHDQTDH